MLRMPKSVLALVIACAISVLVAVVLAVVVINNSNRTADINKDLIDQLAILTTQNRGPRGDDGLSAYEIWLSLGNTGSEQDFIESLRGKPGTNGIDGRDGSAGSSGSNGLSVGKGVCTGTSINWYLTNNTYIGSTPLVCIP
jgi:hypothetical protein